MKLSRLDDLPETLSTDKAGNRMIEKLMHLTLDILYLLTGEDYIVLKMSGGRVTHSSSTLISGGFGRTQSHVMEPPPQSLIHERNNDLKILELTNKIIQLLTGEEWEYLKGNKDSHRDIKKEPPQTAISPDDYNSENPSENFPSAVLLQKSMEDHHVLQRCVGEIPSRHSSSNPESIGEETYEIGNQWCTVEGMSTQIGTDGSNMRNSLRRQLVPLYPQDSPATHPSVTPGDQSKDVAGLTMDVESCGGDEESEKRVLEEEVSVPTGWIIKDFIVPVTVEGDGPCVEILEQLEVKEEEGDGAERGWRKESPIVPVIVGVGELSDESIQVKEEEEIHSGDKRGEEAKTPTSATNAPGTGAVRLQQSAEWEIHEDGSTHPLTPGGQPDCKWKYVSPSRIPDFKKEPGEINKLPCPECGKCFTGAAQLEAHRKVHTGESPFSCSECGKTFSSFSSLCLHLKTHSGEKLFACPECGKCFAVQANLLAHQKVHAGEKPFACAECGRCFALKSSLDTHLPVHALEKPFMCPSCGKCFTTSARLTMHQHTHIGEKSYECEDCGKGFTTAGSLNRHKRTHTGEKPYACMVCGKCFNRETNLYRHQMIHTR